jgi:putative SOS response-associated peptidase YedK
MLQVDGKRTLELFRWGLIPWWAKDPAIGNRMINALANWYGWNCAGSPLTIAYTGHR